MCTDCPPPSPTPPGDCKDCEKKKKPRRKKLPAPPVPDDCVAPCISPAPQVVQDNTDCDDRWDAGVNPANPPMGNPVPTATIIGSATATYGTGTRTGTRTITRTETTTSTSTSPGTGGENYLSSALTRIFYKDSCPDGYAPTPYVFTLPSGAFRSAISQQDADDRAKAYMARYGQMEANSKGVCEYAPLGLTLFTNGLFGAPQDCPPPEELLYGLILGPAVCED